MVEFKIPLGLTGKTRFRPFKGKLVLQLQESYSFIDSYGGGSPDFKSWRDATIEDITELDNLTKEKNNVK